MSPKYYVSFIETLPYKKAFPSIFLLLHSIIVLLLFLCKVEQGIERKYLIPPLGDDEETKKRKQQEAADAAQAEFYEMMAAGGKRKKDKMVKNENEESGSQGELTIALDFFIKRSPPLL